MRTIRTLLAATAMLLAAAAGGQAAGARVESHAAPNKNLVQTAVAAGQFKTLTKLLERAGLVKALEGKQRYTVFAPTDAAFAKVPKATLAKLAQHRAKLRAVLLYHVAKGRLTAAKVVKRHSIKTLNGQRLRVRVRHGKVYVGRARVITPDVAASNGVIHVINRVLIPALMARIAVVGAGISGLVVAHLLHEAHDVTVFEAAGRAGGHAHTVRVDTPNQTHHVDTGFIVFNDRNYPSFERLLARLGVAWQRSSMSFSVSDGVGDFEYSSASPNGLFAKRAHLFTPGFHRMVADLARFHRAARELLLDGADDVSLGEWLERGRFSRAFVERLIVPQASAVWSADPRQIWSFPARFLVEFFDNHGMLSFRGRPRWRAVQGGSARYVDALTRPFRRRLRLNTPVAAVSRHADHVLVTPRGGEPERFDDVVLATHSDQALALLRDATDREHAILGALPYQPNEAVLHTDVSLLPRRRRAWASWNYHLLAEPQAATAVTYHMNRLQSLRAERELCVTLNRTAAIDPAQVIRTIPYAHPVYTTAGVVAQARVSEIDGRNRTHFCGAYWGWGFHEDGVVSALRVGERFGARL